MSFDKDQAIAIARFINTMNDAAGNGAPVVVREMNRSALDGLAGDAFCVLFGELDYTCEDEHGQRSATGDDAIEWSEDKDVRTIREFVEQAAEQIVGEGVNVENALRAILAPTLLQTRPHNVVFS